MTQPAGRVLALRALGLGDLLTAVPALRGLRRAYPDQRFVLAAPGWLEPVATLTGAIDGVLDTVPLGRVPGWPPRLAVNLHGRGPQSTQRLRELGAGEVWAYDTAGAPAWDEDEHEVQRWCRLLEAHDVECDPLALDLTAPDEPPLAGGLTVVHPGGAAPVRRWPASRWSIVAEALADAGHDVVVTGSIDELDLARAVAAGAGLAPDAVVAGRLDITGLCAVIACARLVLSSDTGVAHLATAYRTPSVVLFGPVSPTRWGPPAGRRQHAVLWSGSTSDPFAAAPDPGLLKLTPEDVLAALPAPARR